MAKFFPIKVKDVYKETEDCSVVTFDVPEDLKSDFKYHQGQHLTLKKDINGEDVRRSYSLCSSPVDDEWKVAVKQIFEGKFSTYVNQQLKANDIIEVMPPSGDFGVDIKEDIENTYLFFAAGSGITPVLSMIKTHLAKEPNANCKLFYLNKNAKSIIFKEEIEQIRNKYFGRFEIFYFLTREQRDIELLNGRFTPEKIQLLANSVFDIDQVTDVFICGPEQMIFMIRDEFTALGLNKNQIHYELFVTGISEEDKKRAEAAMAKREDGTEITILDGGKEFHFIMNKDYENILDAALAAGADLPFACKGGVCSTCKCKLMEGDVEMKVNYALEKDEVEQNFVLSCQAIPTSKRVTVDFDV
ncbi:2Fe-2S iron-sulfur cluster-binding protein [Psychroflexus lacisalsi]|jgi:ring-1,2-phenylacetyl-CoA epoxidase subunit PaaE|uniref:Phenylacetate-CoA oxygenase/reductase subunit PaaK n=1 Tax=Psychroflexus lacisalsi TaxID=503928 RepID=A0ABN1K5X3_9FLAO|nr:2Fe-2S iron-sulfur cluster-binding protein [Psychroflexus lacisalsi]MBZ9619209.1 2Fe-2S iron-sulfur cluster binding domain-containing protein [Psychroflexus lacisalsi]